MYWLSISRAISSAGGIISSTERGIKTRPPVASASDVNHAVTVMQIGQYKPLATALQCQLNTGVLFLNYQRGES